MVPRDPECPLSEEPWFRHGTCERNISLQSPCFFLVVLQVQIWTADGGSRNLYDDIVVLRDIGDRCFDHSDVSVAKPRESLHGLSLNMLILWVHLCLHGSHILGPVETGEFSSTLWGWIINSHFVPRSLLLASFCWICVSNGSVVVREHETRLLKQPHLYKCLSHDVVMTLQMSGKCYF